MKLARVAPGGSQGHRPRLSIGRNLPGSQVSTWLNYQAFNPLTVIGWHTAFWASDPAWTNPGDGGAVSSWRDGTNNGRDATQATGAKQPTWRAATSVLGSRPTVQGDGGDYLQTASFTAINSPVTVIVIGAFTVTTSGQNLIDGPTATSTNRVVIGTTTGPVWLAYAGAMLSGGTADTNGHMFRAYATDAGSGDALSVDGAATASGNAGTTGIPWNTIALFANGNGGTGTGFASAHIAFAGVYVGDLTAHAQWAAFKAWVRSYYALTVA